MLSSRLVIVVDRKVPVLRQTERTQKEPMEIALVVITIARQGECTP